MKKAAESSAVDPHAVERYLATSGWYVDSEIRKVATVWHRSDSQDAEVVLPVSASVRDYGLRMQEALAAIADHDNRDVAELSRELRRSVGSMMSVRVQGYDTADGVIPLSEGILLIEKAKELFYSAAMSMYAKKRHFSGRLNAAAKDYIDSLLLGQTEVGSYIVNILAPDQSGVDESGDASGMGGAVFQSVVAGIEALKLAVDQGDINEAPGLMLLDQAVVAGASSNMCEALLGFSGSSRNRDFSITISAAPGPLLPAVRREFNFDVPSVRGLERAATYYKDDYTLPGREITGFVKKLIRQKGQEVGRIAVDATVSDVERTVLIDLEQHDYHLSVIAHDRRLLVRCVGDVQVKGSQAWLLNPRGFRVLAGDGDSLL